MAATSLSIRSGAFCTDLGARILRSVVANERVQLNIRDAIEFVHMFAPLAHTTSPHTLCDRLNAIRLDPRTSGVSREFCAMEAIRNVLYEAAPLRRNEGRASKRRHDKPDSVVSETTNVHSTFSRAITGVLTA